MKFTPFSLSDERNRKWRVWTERQMARKSNSIPIRCLASIGVDAILHNDPQHNRRRIRCAIIKVAAKYEVSLFFPLSLQPRLFDFIVKIHLFLPPCDVLASDLRSRYFIHMRLKFRTDSNWTAKHFEFFHFEFELVLTMHLVAWHDMTADCWLVRQKQVRRSLLIRCTTCMPNVYAALSANPHPHEATVKMTKNNCRTRVASEVRSMFDRLFKRN